jgi:N-acetylglucosaminyldiphosphoundecaprenol N-acetyl-beta-D-mannosaminyltransferase
MRPEGSVQPRPNPVPAPPMASLLGVRLALTDYGQTLDWIEAMVAAGQRGYICVCNVHTLMAAREDSALQGALRGSSLNVPDGQPLVWAVNALGHSLQKRVYGPELMAQACARAAETGLRFYLYGGRNQGALFQLALNLRQRYPGIKIVGGYSPTSCGWGSACPSRKSGWTRCGHGSRHPS